MSDDIGIAQPILGGEEVDRVEAVIESERIADGPEVRAFESEFAEFCGAAHGVATSNGTTALHTALSALGVGPGDTVLTTPFSFIATANAVRFTGADPVFADVDPNTFNLDPESVERRIEDLDGDVDAIVAVHLYGLPAPMDELRAIADRYDVPLVEDAAQAHGATYRETPVGAIGDVACFSFYPTKNMTTGEGGMVVTDDESTADAAAQFVNHGRETDGYRHVALGHNFRMTSLAAAIGRVQLERLPGFIESRRENAARLTAHLEETALRTPYVPAGSTHSYHQYTVRCGNRDDVADQLADHGIGTGVYYPRCIHDQPAYDDYDESHPVAERLAEQALSLPVHPGLSEESVDRIGRTLREEVTVEPPEPVEAAVAEVDDD